MYKYYSTNKNATKQANAQGAFFVVLIIIPLHNKKPPSAIAWMIAFVFLLLLYYILYHITIKRQVILPDTQLPLCDFCLRVHTQVLFVIALVLNFLVALQFVLVM